MLGKHGYESETSHWFLMVIMRANLSPTYECHFMSPGVSLYRMTEGVTSCHQECHSII